jgi:hypothetical protein
MIDEERAKVKLRFLTWCEKIGYTDNDHPVSIEIVDGLPMVAHRAVQDVRFDKDLTKAKQNTTME